jgi:hypothetical protein
VEYRILSFEDFYLNLNHLFLALYILIWGKCTRLGNRSLITNREEEEVDNNLLNR